MNSSGQKCMHCRYCGRKLDNEKGYHYQKCIVLPEGSSTYSSYNQTTNFAYMMYGYTARVQIAIPYTYFL